MPITDAQSGPTQDRTQSAHFTPPSDGRGRSYFEGRAPDPREIHEHHAGIDPRDAVERVAREAAVPTDLRDFVFGRHCRQLGAVEGLEEAPDIIHGPQEEHVRVHVEQRVHVLQHDLETHRDS